MVREAYYGFGWHSRMCSRAINGVQAFVDGEANRKLIHASELRKSRYLVAKFLAKLRAGGMIYVIKSNSGIDPVCVDMIAKELRRLSGGAEFWVLEIRRAQDDAQIGHCVRAADHHLVGYVKEFADYNTADHFDLTVYEAILRHALTLADYPAWDDALHHVEETLAAFRTSLPFPQKNETGEGDFVTAYPKCEATLLNSHWWSRKLETQFRLHAFDETTARSRLVWQKVQQPGEWAVGTSIALSVLESLPVDVCLVVTINGQIVGEHREVVTSMAPMPFAVTYRAEEGDDIAIAIEPICRQQRSAEQVSVIDIEELTLEKA